MYREKVDAFLNTISRTPDSDFVDLIDELINASAEYIRRVVVLEAAVSVGKFNKEGAAYRENIQTLDGNRSAAHNSLIVTVKAINGLCRKHAIPLIFEGSEEKRIEIADFAQQLVDEYFSTRKL